MKKILCKVTAVELNLKDYGKNIFDNLSVPNIGDEVVIEREDWYPFNIGLIDGEGVYPPIDANGQKCSRILYYVHLTQVSLV